MNELFILNVIQIVWLCISLVIFISLFFITAPYGRHKKSGWGIMLGSRLAWILMETPSPVIMFILFLTGNHIYLLPVIFLLMWEAHYIHRAFIFPFRRHNSKASFPVLILFFGFLFNVVNAYLNGRYLFYFAPDYTMNWLFEPRFSIGLALFITGMTVNIYSDLILIDLRKSNSESYKIPESGLFHFVSCPNYLGEIVEWSGWAIATWSIPGLLFALWTFANLAPRARSNHAWYLKEFPDYPKTRKALIPFLF